MRLARLLTLGFLAISVFGCSKDTVQVSIGGQCMLNSDCDEGLACRLGTCRVECRTDRDCDGQGQCLIEPGRNSGVCQLPEEEECKKRTDCPEGLVCAFEQCLYSCEEDDECASGSTCATDEESVRACLGGGSTLSAIDAGSDDTAARVNADDDEPAQGAPADDEDISDDPGPAGVDDDAAGDDDSGGMDASVGDDDVANDDDIGDDDDGATDDDAAQGGSGGEGASGGRSGGSAAGASGSSGGETSIDVLEPATPGEPIEVGLVDDFEGGIGLWFADNGLWQVGTPTVGPESCFSGEQCLGTVLDGNYPGETDSRFVGSSVQLPSLAAGEELQLRFMHWASLSSYDSGGVQVSVWDEALEDWGEWSPLGAPVVNTSSAWSRKAVDLTSFQGKRMRLSFYHEAVRSGSFSSESSGWYIDDVAVVRFSPGFTGDFEQGWGDWYADGGLWEWGSPAAGPMACYSGESCIGTVLDGNYGALTDSSLISATVQLPEVSGPEELQLRFWHWFSYSSYDEGSVEILVWNADVEEWQPSETESPAYADVSSGWTQAAVPLTALAGERVRIAFSHRADRSGSFSSESSGWYIDEVSVITF